MNSQHFSNYQSLDPSASKPALPVLPNSSQHSSHTHLSQKLAFLSQSNESSASPSLLLNDQQNSRSPSAKSPMLALLQIPSVLEGSALSARLITATNAGSPSLGFGSPVTRIISPPKQHLKAPLSAILLSPTKASYPANHNAIISGMNGINISGDDSESDDNYHHVRAVLSTMDSETTNMDLLNNGQSAMSTPQRKYLGNGSLGIQLSNERTDSTQQRFEQAANLSPMSTPKFVKKSLRITTNEYAQEAFRREYPKSAMEPQYNHTTDVYENWQERQYENPYTPQYSDRSKYQVYNPQQQQETPSYSNTYQNSGMYQQDYSNPQYAPQPAYQQQPHSAVSEHPPKLPVAYNYTTSSYPGPKSASVLDTKKPFSNQRSPTKFRSAYLEEFKISKQKHELKDVFTHVVEFCTDQHGSRFIQLKLDSATPQTCQIITQEMIESGQALMLMSDVFGNYVIQKLFELGSMSVRNDLCKVMVGNVRELSMGMYGCRVIQKALDCVEITYRKSIVEELDGFVLECVKDQNGNHVIQKSIERCDAKDVHFFIDAFNGNVNALATHPYGCRVVQRVFEHMPKSDSDVLLKELLEVCVALIQDQYGNYVIQHILEKGSPSEKQAIIKAVRPHIIQMSKHKYASNVIEKCVHFTTATDRTSILSELYRIKEDGVSILTLMMKDPFANYVVQRLLESVHGEERVTLLEKIRPHLGMLKKFTYGKHLIAKVEKFLGIAAGTVPLGEEL